MSVTPISQRLLKTGESKNISNLILKLKTAVGSIQQVYEATVNKFTQKMCYPSKWNLVRYTLRLFMYSLHCYVCGGESVLIWTSTNLRHQHFYTIELVREQKIFCDTAAVFES